jgi:capsular exopolysaccharide synthesis family protein
VEIQRYWAVIRKWLWLIIIGIVAAGGIAYVLSQRMEPVYRATATFLVHETTNNPITGYEYSQPAVTTHAELVKTRSVMEAVSSELQKLGIYYSSKELDGMISAHTNLNTPIIEVSAENTNPLRAQQIANTTVEVYIQQYREKLQDDAKQALSQIQSEIDQDSTRIDELESKKDTTGLTSDEENELASLQDDLGQLKYLRTTWNLELAQVLATGGISQGESASLPTSPVSPKTTQNVILASILGLMVTTGGAFLKEYLDRSVKSAEDISHLTRLPTLGVIAKFKTNPGEKGGLIAEAHPRSSVAEAFRMLCTNLQFASLEKPIQTLLVTSAGPGEGKTSVSANLAVTIAQMGKKVIAVDADLRRHELHKFFHLPNTTGFTNLLLAQQPDVAGFLQPTKVEGLRVLASGPYAHNPAELLSSPRISFLIEELKKEADVVLLDTSPVLAVADATIIAPKVDGIVLVVEVGRTRPEALIETKEALSKGNVNILGVVLNRMEVAGRGGYYYHYRYPYYQYYYDYGEDGHKKRHKRRRPLASEKATASRNIDL